MFAHGLLPVSAFPDVNLPFVNHLPAEGVLQKPSKTTARLVIDDIVPRVIARSELSEQLQASRFSKLFPSVAELFRSLVLRGMAFDERDPHLLVTILALALTLALAILALTSVLAFALSFAFRPSSGILALLAIRRAFLLLHLDPRLDLSDGFLIPIQGFVLLPVARLVLPLGRLPLFPVLLAPFPSASFLVLPAVLVLPGRLSSVRLVAPRPVVLALDLILLPPLLITCNITALLFPLLLLHPVLLRILLGPTRRPHPPLRPIVRGRRALPLHDPRGRRTAGRLRRT
mmetsp:Transcript_164785/g.528680  ORF Transcript_164785/g.528680 Transcript_164785/m.528680 type:complete len:288 (+) Transcript_164785:849-1712(+)